MNNYPEIGRVWLRKWENIIEWKRTGPHLMEANKEEFRGIRSWASIIGNEVLEENLECCMNEEKEQHCGCTLSGKKNSQWQKVTKSDGAEAVTAHAVWQMKMSRAHVVHAQGYLASYVKEWWGCVSGDEEAHEKETTHIRLLSLKKDQNQEATMTEDPSPEWIYKGIISHLQNTHSNSYQGGIWKTALYSQET